VVVEVVKKNLEFLDGQALHGEARRLPLFARMDLNVTP
jgi:hypothetical protein